MATDDLQRIAVEESKQILKVGQIEPMVIEAR